MEQKVKCYSNLPAVKIALNIDDEMKAGWLVKSTVIVDGSVIVIYERKKRKAVDA